MTDYLVNGNNDNLSITHSYESKLGMILDDFPSADISADVINFDIGVEGETALYSGVATITLATAPQQIELTIPAGTFTEPHKKLVLQLRWTESGENERVIYKGFLDVRAPVTPTP